MAVKSAEQTNLYYAALHLWRKHFHGSHWKGANEGINFNLKAGKIAQVGV